MLTVEGPFADFASVHSKCDDPLLLPSKAEAPWFTSTIEAGATPRPDSALPGLAARPSSFLLEELLNALVLLDTDWRGHFWSENRYPNDTKSESSEIKRDLLVIR